MAITKNEALKFFYNDIIYNNNITNTTPGNGCTKFFTNKGRNYKVQKSGGDVFSVSLYANKEVVTFKVKDVDGAIAKKLQEFKGAMFKKGHGSSPAGFQDKAAYYYFNIDILSAGNFKVKNGVYKSTHDTGRSYRITKANKNQSGNPTYKIDMYVNEGSVAGNGQVYSAGNVVSTEIADASGELAVLLKVKPKTTVSTRPPVKGGRKPNPKPPENTGASASITEEAPIQTIEYYQDETVDPNEVGAFYRETKFKLDGKPVYRILNKDLTVAGEQFFIFESGKNNRKIFLAKTGDSWRETGRSDEPEICEESREVIPKSAAEYQNVGELKEVNSVIEGTRGKEIALPEGKTLRVENTIEWEGISKKSVIAYTISGGQKTEKIEYDIDYSKPGAIIITKKTKNLSNNSEEKIRISYDFENQKAYII